LNNRLPFWRVVGASVAGTSHIQHDIPCQDNYAVRVLDSHVLIAAVADGLGSASRSDEGARIASCKAVESLETTISGQTLNLDEEWLREMKQSFGKARESLLLYANEQMVTAREFATTLTCIVLTEDQIVVGHLGDGFVVAEDRQGLLHTIARPQRGEYANEVCPLTADNALEFLDIQLCRFQIKSILLSTDGMLRLALKLPDATPYEPFFRPLIDFVAKVETEEMGSQNLGQFLTSDRVCERTDDDKTLVIVTRLDLQ